MTFEKTAAGLNAQSKGRRLGIYEVKKKRGEELDKKAGKQAKLEFIELLGRSVPATRTSQGLRALIKGKQIDSESVQKYLKQKFGDNLGEARAACVTTAAFRVSNPMRQTYPSS